MSESKGTIAFMEGLRGLGYAPKILPDAPNHVYFDYTVEAGKFSGTKVRLGFSVPPDFPNITPTGPHVSPCLLPTHPANDKPHPVGGVHATSSGEFIKGAGGEWQYWSRPTPNWGQSKKTVTVFMAHIHRLWETQ